MAALQLKTPGPLPLNLGPRLTLILLAIYWGLTGRPKAVESSDDETRRAGEGCEGALSGRLRGRVIWPPATRSLQSDDKGQGSTVQTLDAH